MTGFVAGARECLYKSAQFISTHMTTAALATAAMDLFVAQTAAATAGVAVIGDVVTTQCWDHVCSNGPGPYREMARSVGTTAGSMVGTVFSLPGGCGGSEQVCPVMCGAYTAVAATSLHLQLSQFQRTQQHSATNPAASETLLGGTIVGQGQIQTTTMPDSGYGSTTTPRGSSEMSVFSPPSSRVMT